MGNIMKEPLIYSGCDIRNRQNIEFGENVIIQGQTWIDVHIKGKLILKDGCNIGRRCVIGCGKQVTIGKKVLLAPNVYIADISHEYRDIEKPIVDQGITSPVPIEIGDGSWCGINSVILASVGSNCVVGANSVITKNVPDYCVVAGQPARIIRRYNFKKKRWERVSHRRNWLTRFFQFFKPETSSFPEGFEDESEGCDGGSHNRRADRTL